MSSPAARAVGLRSLAGRLDPVAATVLLEAAADLDRLSALERAIGVPTVTDFDRGVVLEAAHQADRWGTGHDADKSASDWVWLVAHLVTKSAEAWRAGNFDRARHHAISAAAVLRTWHGHVSAAAEAPTS